MQFEKRHSDEVTQSAIDFFRINYFIFIINEGHSSLQTRFAKFKNMKKLLDFCLDCKRLKDADDHSLLWSCQSLENSLTILKYYLPTQIKRVIDTLNFF